MPRPLREPAKARREAHGKRAHRHGVLEYGNVRLTAQVTPLSSGSTLRASTTGKTGLPAILLAGAPSAGAQVLSFGELYVSLGTMLVLPFGTIPHAQTRTLPALGGESTLQALAIGLPGANLSNPVRLRFP